MKHNYSMESQITNGRVQYIEDIKIDFNTIKILCQEMSTSKKTVIEVVGFSNFKITLDFSEDEVSSRDEFTLQSIIGFTYEKKKNGYLYCLKTDDYEVMFESKYLAKITKL